MNRKNENDLEANNFLFKISLNKQNTFDFVENLGINLQTNL